MSDLAKAERVVREELSKFDWTELDLRGRRKGDARKLAVALRLRRESTRPWNGLMPGCTWAPAPILPFSSNSINERTQTNQIVQKLCSDPVPFRYQRGKLSPHPPHTIPARQKPPAFMNSRLTTGARQCGDKLRCQRGYSPANLAMANREVRLQKKFVAATTSVPRSPRQRGLRLPGTG